MTHRDDDNDSLGELPKPSNDVLQVWLIRTDDAIWTFYDDTFRGAIRQWLDVMDAVAGPQWQPAQRGSTLIRVEHSPLGQVMS